MALWFSAPVRHPSAAWPQVSAAPPPWTSVLSTRTPQTARPMPNPNRSPSARFTPQVPSTAPFTPPPETRARQNAPSTQTHQPTAPSMPRGARTVPSTPQGRLQTAPCTPPGLTMVKAITTAPCTGTGPRPSRPQTALYTPQGYKSASAPQSQTHRRRRQRRGTTVPGSRVTRAA